METIEKLGVMASITWNSNRWKDNPTDEDLTSSKYDHVRDHAVAHESLNFAHDSIPVERDGWFVGYSPVIKDRRPAPNNPIQVLFLISTNHSGDKKRYVVGMYGFPQFAEQYPRLQKLPTKYRSYDYGNFRSKPEDIILLDHYLPIDNDLVQEEKLLPLGKKISQRGWNYLDSGNVENLLKYALAKNPNQARLKRLTQKLGMAALEQPDSSLFDFEESDADTLTGIAALEAKMINATPEKKERISTSIERGAISGKVKKITGYRCLVCEALNQSPIGFLKAKDGRPYVEAHHVIPVARQEKGSLSATNIITVCANHHRQFHFGKVSDLKHSEKTFEFDFDGVKITIPKISITQ